MIIRARYLAKPRSNYNYIGGYIIEERGTHGGDQYYIKMVGKSKMRLMGMRESMRYIRVR